ncbi:hypothetical protein BRAS3843_2820021 [Bradyrhizobium sp. STM 3843]|nr:hypothetical protein BRAS3843_2820021 [Bradyrhizobium sp. STM 3843]
MPLCRSVHFAAGQPNVTGRVDNPNSNLAG